MTLLQQPDFCLVIGVIVTGIAIIVIHLGIYIYIICKPTSKEEEEYANAIQEGMNQVDVDFEVKRPIAMFQCPYDHLSCDHIDTLTMTTDIRCEDCPRYTGIKPPKF